MGGEEDTIGGSRVVTHDRAGGAPQPRPLTVFLLQPARLEARSPHPRTRASTRQATDVAPVPDCGCSLWAAPLTRRLPLSLGIPYWSVKSNGYC